MRALVIVLDSVGVGGAPDAAGYGDAGANTLGHILEGRPDLKLPNLSSLGLPWLLGQNSLATPDGSYEASYGRMRPRSAGKDTTTGHWEIAGVVLEEPFSICERFPAKLVNEIEREARVRFIGNIARSGTTILDEFGPEHLQSGSPILYTSADSVLQIAAHDEIVPLERLYEICRVARKAADPYRIGRVIARPFAGPAGAFRRTEMRRDFSMKPPRTILNALAENLLPVIGIGKISDIFAGEGITESHPTKSNRAGMEKISELWSGLRQGLIFANLVDFDMLFGHRRDLAGYAAALREFDDWLAHLLRDVHGGDLVMITADHGNDPTFRGTDHTREEVPLFVLNGESRKLGTRETFADVAATLSDYFGIAPWPVGISFLRSGVRQSALPATPGVTASVPAS